MQRRSMDLESSVLHSGLRLLGQIEPAARRRVMAYWNARAEALPLIDTRGNVLEEHPRETEPPMIPLFERRETIA